MPLRTKSNCKFIVTPWATQARPKIDIKKEEFEQQKVVRLKMVTFLGKKTANLSENRFFLSLLNNFLMVFIVYIIN